MDSPYCKQNGHELLKFDSDRLIRAFINLPSPLIHNDRQKRDQAPP
jgi:hypothetical protein